MINYHLEIFLTSFMFILVIIAFMVFYNIMEEEVL